VLNIKPETKDDFIKVTQIIDAAFGQPNEGRLIENLRLNKKFISRLSLVAILNDELVGHIFFPDKNNRRKKRARIYFISASIGSSKASEKGNRFSVNQRRIGAM
jgi:hypothetical protein